MKKVLKIIVLVMLMSVLFTGCESFKSLELKNRLIIQGIGIDIENGEVKVTLQALNTNLSSNPNSGSAPKEVVNIYNVSGKSISDAINNVTLVTGKKPLLSQNRVIVFGNDVAKSGLSYFCDFFVRDPESRATVVVAVAKEKASDIISVNLGEGVIPARDTESILDASIINGTTPTVRLFEFVNDILDSNKSGLMPVLAIEETDEKKQISLVSTAIFQRDKMIAEIDFQSTSGYLWIDNNVVNAKIPFETNGDILATINIIDSKCKVKAEVVDNKPKITVDISCSLDCSEVNDDIFKIETEKDILEMEKNVNKKIKEIIEKSIRECIIKNNSDIFGFGTQLKLNEPKYYKNNVTDWSESMKDMQYEIKVDSKIKLVGESVLKRDGKL